MTTWYVVEVEPCLTRSHAPTTLTGATTRATARQYNIILNAECEAEGKITCDCSAAGSA